MAPAFQASVGDWQKTESEAGDKMRAFLFLALLVVGSQAIFTPPKVTDFTAKRCELKLFGVAYFRGINDVVTSDVKYRKTYVDDKSLYTSGKIDFAFYIEDRNQICASEGKGSKNEL